MASDSRSGDVRRFKPELVESTSRSSRMHNEDTHPTSSKLPSSSRVESQTPDINQSRHNKGGPEASPAQPEKPRRFLPQPTETSSRSSKKGVITGTGLDRKDDKDSSDKNQLSNGRLKDLDDSKKSTRPLPQPFEVKQSKGKPLSHDNTEHQRPQPEKEGNNSLNTGKPARKFRPEPIETVKMSRRKPAKTGSGSNSSSTQSTPRKFAPQLIETGKRSFRRAETLPNHGVARSYDEAFVTDGLPRRPGSPPVSRGQQMVAGSEESSFPPESRFSYASLLQRQEGRRHSFRVPDLPAIPSNSSEGSENFDLPSLSTTPSASSEGSANRVSEKNRFRESCDERFSAYLLSLEARSAEKQLREQALAAFPNEQEHQSVSHFAIDGDEDFGNEEDMSRIMNRANNNTRFRRESATDLAWELKEMRRHKEEAELKDLGVQKSDAHESRFSAAAIAARQPKRPNDEASLFTGWRRDRDLVQMRHAASPPMLGDDIVFVLSASPQGTASETDQLVSANQTEPEPAGHGDQQGLWAAEMNVDNEEGPGLWHGLCHHEEGDDRTVDFHWARTGIATPRPDTGAFGGSYFDMKDADADEDELHADSDVRSVDMMETDPTLPEIVVPEEEFNDAFVTQVYNYLSLGYPSLARYFDHELSKISGIPVADLRANDLNAEAKGYVVTADKSDKNLDKPVSEKCMRWKALRLYINEWARQQPEIDLNNDDSLDAWGVIERRGSWAI